MDKIVFLAILVLFSAPIKADNFATCILSRMPDSKNNASTVAIYKYCVQKHPNGLESVKQGSGRGMFSYKSGAECAADKASQTPNERAGKIIYASCIKLYDDLIDPWEESSATLPASKQIYEKKRPINLDTYDNSDFSDRKNSFKSLDDNRVLPKLVNYEIEGRFVAPFPGNPKYEGEISNGKIKYRSYSYTDEKNLIVYTATYQVGVIYLKDEIQSLGLRNFVKGNAASIGGEIAFYNDKYINGNIAAIFSINYLVNNKDSVTKYGAVLYKDGRFYQWAVQEFQSHSHISAEQVFKQNVGKISVR